MKKLSAIILTLFVLSIFGCKGDSDVLVTYKDGNITRGEFYSQIGNNKKGKSSLLKKKSYQKRRLKKIAINKLSVIEAKKTGFDKKKIFIEFIEFAKKNALSRYYQNKLRKDVTFKEDAVRLSVIKFRVKNYKRVNKKTVKLTEAELVKEFAKKTIEAKDIIKKLESGGKFPDLAKKHSDDFSKKNGGDMGYIISGMRNPELFKAGMSLKAGEYTKEPLKAKNGVYIIKLEDKTVITPDSLTSVIKDEKQAMKLTRVLQGNSGKKKIDAIMNNKNIVNNIEKASFKDPKSLLFKIDNKNFTIKDFNNILQLQYKINASIGKNPMTFENTKIKKIAMLVFTTEILSSKAIEEKADKDEEFTTLWKRYYDLYLSDKYKRNNVAGGIEITKDEIKAEYFKNKDRVYTKKIKKGKTTIKKVKPLSEVTEQIKHKLFNKKRAKKIREWERKILKDNEFKVIDSELEGK